MRFSRLILVLAAVLACESRGSNPLESPASMATIHGSVTNSGSPISGAEVSLTAPGIARSATTGPDGSFAFANLPPAVYTLTVGQAGLSCEPTTFEVEAGETVTAGIACLRTGRLAGRVRFPDGSAILDARVAVSGPISREVRTDASGRFVFDELLPGEYTVTVTATDAGSCQGGTATVQVAQLTILEILCGVFNNGLEIEGDWFMHLPREDDFGNILFSQSGNCPPLLPENDEIRSIAFDSLSGMI